MTANRYVLFVCGGKWQRPWLRFLKDKGHKIVLVDPYTFSPCVPDADVHIQCDARDINGIFKRVDGRFDIEFVTSDQTDVSCLTVAELSHRWGLRGNTPEAVERFSNKFRNREFVRQHFHNHIPSFTKVSSTQEVAGFYSGSSGPIMIKPVDAQSSRGIARIDATNIDQAGVLFDQAMRFSKEGYVIAEKFLEGKEITVEGICIDRRHTTLATSDKKHFRTGLASELRYPSAVNPSLLQNLVEFHNDFVEKTGLQFGITHSEYIINREETNFWMVEAACRGGGSLISSHITRWVSGIDVYEAFYAESTGHSARRLPVPERRPAILYFFEFPSGRVSHIHGVEIARAFQGVVALEMEFEVGSVLKSATDDRSRQGYVIIFADTQAQLDKILSEVVNTIKVTLE